VKVLEGLEIPCRPFHRIHSYLALKAQRGRILYQVDLLKGRKGEYGTCQSNFSGSMDRDVLKRLVAHPFALKSFPDYRGFGGGGLTIPVVSYAPLPISTISRSPLGVISLWMASFSLQIPIKTDLRCGGTYWKLSGGMTR
jgi:hypothetical protein